MKVSQNQNNDNDMKAAFLCRPTILGTPSKKKIEKFGDFVLKGGRGSFQKPNFYMPLIWDI